MQPFDAATLFAVNAISLVVFTVTYILAWSRSFDGKYWLNLTIADAVFAVAFLMFSQRVDGSKEMLLLPNCLLVIGLGFRWQAIRSFFGHKPTYLLSIILTALVAGLLYMSDDLGTGLVFGGVNVAIAIQIIVIIHALVREQHEYLPSRWGLAIAYGVIAASSALRVMQGWMLESGMDSLLPHDVFLNIHLVAAAIHIVASGAFSLSLAYELGTHELQQAASRDPLTGLYNRLGLENALARRPDPLARQYAVILIDIDDFKHINDTRGHMVGDAVIKACGDTIKRSLRATDLVARVGGEEFVAVLPQISRDEAHTLSERVRTAVEQEEVSAGNATVRFTISIGLSHANARLGNFSELIVDADKHLYRAKAEGKNRVTSAPLEPAAVKTDVAG
ncbi:MAG: GGDEF domain-containing protein [Chelatococcus sp.]|uniref:GGDEF domain-containing protein n=1 Tax=Chelatococcus sp. TaxID=1953771 RepID=UPI0025BCF5A9|nr:GGDEF domain-containing protein [Chelatococcus sp.]MBX3539102.1 GGDEF domain-containing protein [Chelatococcus sp.]